MLIDQLGKKSSRDFNKQSQAKIRWFNKEFKRPEMLKSLPKDSHSDFSQCQQGSQEKSR